MTWKKWKIGLAIALGCGLLSAGMGLTGRMDPWSFVAVLCTSLLTHFLTFLKNHPLEDVQDESDQMKNKLLSLFFLSLCIATVSALAAGCASAKVTKTTTTIGANGKPVTVTDEVAVNSFLSSIKNGKYTSTNSDGTSQTLSTDETTPDQQSIAVLAGGVVDLGKSAMLLLKKQTNAPAGTNAPAESP